MKKDDLHDLYDSIQPDPSLEDKVRARVESKTARTRPQMTDPTIAPKRRTVRWVVLAVLAVFILSAIAVPNIRIPVRVNTLSLVRFDSYEQAEKYIRKRQALQNAMARQRGCGFMLGCSSADKSTGTAPSAPSEASSTNTQVPSVDEADLVKTDGNMIYRLCDACNGTRLVTVTADAQEVTVLTLNDCRPVGLYLTDDRLIVITERYTERTRRDKTVRAYYTYVSVYDKNSVLEPIEKLTFPAAYRDSRLTDGRLYLAMIDRYVLQNDKWSVPEVVVSGKSLPVEPDDMFAVPGPAYNNCFTYLAVADAQSGQPLDLKTYYGTFDNMYMNSSALYTAATDYNYGRSLYGYVRGGVNGAIVNRYETDGTSIEYHSTATVPGTVLNQFSMDEYDGYFRIATSLSDDGARLTVFSTDGGLREIAHADGMGKKNGERIYSVRFNGPVCYLVTARQIDPLYLVDLADPAKPVVTAELKIPDVSDYMHMYDDNTVIGIGRQAQGGTFHGMQVTLFDVSDRTDPRKLDQYLFKEHTYSDITRDHKALLYHAAFGQTVFGFPIASGADTGFVLFTTDGRTLSYIGSLRFDDFEAMYDPFVYTSDMYIDRCVMIGPRVYALSSLGLVTAAIEETETGLALTEQETVPFKAV